MSIGRAFVAKESRTTPAWMVAFRAGTGAAGSLRRHWTHRGLREGSARDYQRHPGLGDPRSGVVVCQCWYQVAAGVSLFGWDRA